MRRLGFGKPGGGHFEDEDALSHPDLGSGQADAAGLPHRLDQVEDEGRDLGRGRVLHGFRDPAQNRMSHASDFTNGHFLTMGSRHSHC